MSNEALIGNLTTTITWICFTILGSLGVTCITQSELAGLVSVVVILIFNYINSKYPNKSKWFGNSATSTCNCEEGA